jgi:hypothetical protein
MHLVSCHHPPSLESFHSHESDRPVEGDKLTRREASHFIIAMAARSWIQEEEEKELEKG